RSACDVEECLREVALVTADLNHILSWGNVADGEAGSNVLESVACSEERTTGTRSNEGSRCSSSYSDCASGVCGDEVGSLNTYMASGRSVGGLADARESVR